jgi:hypothetical protein
VLVTAALLVLYTVYIMVMRVMTGNPEPDAATKNNFEQLATEMNSIQEGQKKEVPVFIGKSWFVVGFRESEGLISPQCTQTDKAMKRPSTCIGPCICLCTTANSCVPKADCRSVPVNPVGTVDCSIPLVMGSEKVQVASISRSKDSVSLGTKPLPTVSDDTTSEDHYSNDELGVNY